MERQCIGWEGTRSGLQIIIKKTSAMVAQTASASQETGPQSPTVLDYDQRARDVAISNVSHAINLALSNFAESFSWLLGRSFCSEAHLQTKYWKLFSSYFDILWLFAWYDDEWWFDKWFYFFYGTLSVAVYGMEPVYPINVTKRISIQNIQRCWSSAQAWKENKDQKEIG